MSNYKFNHLLAQVIFTIFAISILASCGGGSASQPPQASTPTVALATKVSAVIPPSTVAPPITVTPTGIWMPTPGTSFQWQLTGTIDTTLNVQMYNIDLFDTPVATITDLKSRGKKVICYLSAGSYENWRPDAGSFPASLLGNALSGWQGERWLDIRQISALTTIMGARLDLAVQKGCNGVEPDNVDGYINNSGFALSAQDQVNYNKMLASEAHKRNLSVGLKNDVDQVPMLAPYFDWALNEQCFEYNECTNYSAFININKAVFGVEYNSDPAVFCPKANAANFDFLKKNLSLDAARLSCREKY